MNVQHRFVPALVVLVLTVPALCQDDPNTAAEKVRLMEPTEVLAVLRRAVTLMARISRA